MFAPLMGMMVLVAGLSPAEMAEVVAGRLARLDRLVAEVEVKTYLCPDDADPLDFSSWSPISRSDGLEDGEPSLGGWRVLRLVRPAILTESWITGQAEPLVEGFRPGRFVLRVQATDRKVPYRYYYHVSDNPIMPASRTISMPELFDLQIHDSWIPGLNTLRLLRDYPARLVRSDGRVSTYAVTVRSEDLPPPGGGHVERYELDLNERGTPLRLHQVVEVWTLFSPPTVIVNRQTFTLATMELNGAEMITEAVGVHGRVSLHSTSTYGISHMVVHSVRVDETLSAADVSFEPERRNAIISTETLIPRWTFCEEWEEYDESGRLVAQGSDDCLQNVWRPFLLPVSAACGLVTAAGVAFASRPRRPVGA
jgi:hypothetical protein